ncbi:hypothetical protein EJ05DRAFT_389997 [Pseudovirgaria hyperparasitica]|uniref:MYND-type domain-containing protein n=1 Tax=Pseudovirgaria hyperparasitica TaxID=470096 RepID=A0A6A6W5Z1_9PEZI|nr:uncharacterized protein EJ05DRAFT_389997 [Pseudovirgaria hyperparasitica]KAF2757444.1 hypothetical protein EJ05DRAFT_389997 [Pseudovirgaria hyperparasitica]
MAPITTAPLICAACKKTATDLRVLNKTFKPCEKCKTIQYCSVACKKADHKRHKKICAALEKEYTSAQARQEKKTPPLPPPATPSSETLVPYTPASHQRTVAQQLAATLEQRVKLEQNMKAPTAGLMTPSDLASGIKSNPLYWKFLDESMRANNMYATIENIDTPIHEPLTRLHENRFLHDLAPNDTFALLIDAFRLDEHRRNKADRPSADGIYTGAPNDLVPFRRFVARAHARPSLLPPWWNEAWSQADAELYGTWETVYSGDVWVIERFSNLFETMDPDGVAEYYENSMVPMYLVMFAMRVWDRDAHIGDLMVEALEEKEKMVKVYGSGIGNGDGNGKAGLGGEGKVDGEAEGEKEEEEVEAESGTGSELNMLLQPLTLKDNDKSEEKKPDEKGSGKQNSEKPEAKKLEDKEPEEKSEKQNSKSTASERSEEKQLEGKKLEDKKSEEKKEREENEGVMTGEKASAKEEDEEKKAEEL